MSSWLPSLSAAKLDVRDGALAAFAGVALVTGYRWYKYARIQVRKAGHGRPGEAWGAVGAVYALLDEALWGHVFVLRLAGVSP